MEYEMELSYNGERFKVMVDLNTHVMLLRDISLREEYARTIYKEMKRDNETNTSSGTSTQRFYTSKRSLDNTVTASEVKMSSIPSTSYLPLKSTYDSRIPGSNTIGQSNIKKHKPNNDQGDAEITSFIWTDKLTRCLLECRLQREPQFSNPTCKKSKLWKLTANEVTSITSIEVTPNACDNKYRGLLTTYRTNKQKQKKTGESAITWQYFEIMDVVLGEKDSSDPPVANLGDSLDVPSDVSINEEENNINNSEKKNSKKRTLNTRSLQMYLYEKKQLEEKKVEREREKEEEKRLWKEKKWEETKKLKEKEIDAIVALAKAITSEKK